MKPPTLHILGDGTWLCGFEEDGTNWPEKYMDDEVARFLEFCEGCEEAYVNKHGQEKMDAKRDWMRRDLSQDPELCPCGCHPEGMYIPPSTSDDESIETHTQPSEEVRTLRMYLRGVRV